jgi:hypothetical protein
VTITLPRSYHLQPLHRLLLAAGINNNINTMSNVVIIANINHLKDVINGHSDPSNVNTHVEISSPVIFIEDMVELVEVYNCIIPDTQCLTANGMISQTLGQIVEVDNHIALNGI